MSQSSVEVVAAPNTVSDQIRGYITQTIPIAACATLISGLNTSPLETASALPAVLGTAISTMISMPWLEHIAGSARFGWAEGLGNYARLADEIGIPRDEVAVSLRSWNTVTAYTLKALSTLYLPYSTDPMSAAMSPDDHALTVTLQQVEISSAIKILTGVEVTADIKGSLKWCNNPTFTSEEQVYLEERGLSIDQQSQILQTRVARLERIQQLAGASPIALSADNSSQIIAEMGYTQVANPRDQYIANTYERSLLISLAGASRALVQEFCEDNRLPFTNNEKAILAAEAVNTQILNGSGRSSYGIQSKLYEYRTYRDQYLQPEKFRTLLPRTLLNTLYGITGAVIGGTLPHILGPESAGWGIAIPPLLVGAANAGSFIVAANLARREFPRGEQQQLDVIRFMAQEESIATNPEKVFPAVKRNLALLGVDFDMQSPETQHVFADLSGKCAHYLREHDTKLYLEEISPIIHKLLQGKQINLEEVTLLADYRLLQTDPLHYLATRRDLSGLSNEQRIALTQYKKYVDMYRLCLDTKHIVSQDQVRGISYLFSKNCDPNLSQPLNNFIASFPGLAEQLNSLASAETRYQFVANMTLNVSGVHVLLQSIRNLLTTPISSSIK